MNSAIPTDARLVSDTLSGAPAPFEALVERYFASVFAIAYARTNNHADAEDVAQETFIRAYAKLNTLREPGKFGGWVASIAQRLASNTRRTEQRAAGNVAEVLPEPATPQEMAARKELHGLLRDSITHLDAAHREVLLLHYFAGKKTREIAELLDVSQAAVLKRLQRAREALGTTLLEDARDTFDDSPRTKQRAKTIALAATASAPAWMGAGTAGAAAASGGIGIALKVAAVAALLVAGIVAGRQMTAVSGVDALAQSEQKTLVAPESPHGERVDTDDSAAPAPPRDDIPQDNVETPPTATLAVAAAETGAESSPLTLVQALNGPWSYTVYAVLESSQQLITPNALFATMAYADPELSMEPMPSRILGRNELRSTFGRGEVTDENVTLTLYLGGHEDPDAESVELMGTIAEPFTEMTLTGTLTPVRSPGSKSVDVEVRFVRAADTMLAETATKEKHMEEAQGILDALFAWTDRNGGILPEGLEPLHADPYAHLFEYRPDRTIEYSPQVLDVGLSFSRDFKEFETDSPYRERLIAWEAYLAELWEGDFVPSAPLLRVSYASPDIAFIALHDKPREIRLELNDETDLPAPTDLTARREYNEANRASCQNNLKQLGLVCKMFEQENEPLIPPGWRTAYPDYLADRRVLVCPSRPTPTISYELTYPARSEEFFASVAEAVTGEANALVVPLAVEVHECSEGGGRNVLFFDGRVEFIAESAWDERVAPFLGFE